jgi:hypothetical protein
MLNWKPIEGEEWRDIEGHPGYQVSDHGRVRGKMRMVINRGRPHMKMPELQGIHADKHNYLFVRLSHMGTTKKRYVHQLVCEAWHGEKPADDYSVDHIDRNRGNNIPDNLRWASREEQNANRVLNPNKGSKSNLSKLQEQDVRDIRAMYDGIENPPTYHSVGEQYGVDEATIRKIVTRKNWKHLDNES